ncbi:MAG: hypothetical protein MUF00_09600 [Gemmatimonadaceae bacterium]|nr:hypothetical protein [Gemmatimonadaceae bacterium]
MTPPITATLREVAEVRIPGSAVDTLFVASTRQLTAQALTRSGVRVTEREGDVVWTSADPVRVLVSPTGLVTARQRAVGNGITLTARIGDRQATRRVVVLGVAAVEATGPAALSLGRTGQAVGRAVVDPGVVDGVRWSSTNQSVASISSSGAITPLAFGTTVVSAIALGDSTVRRSVTVRVTGDCRGTPPALSAGVLVASAITEQTCVWAAAEGHRAQPYRLTLLRPTIIVARTIRTGLTQQTAGVFGDGGWFINNSQSASEFMGLMPAGEHIVLAGTYDPAFTRFGSYQFIVFDSVPADYCAPGVVDRGVQFRLALSSVRCASYEPPNSGLGERPTQTLNSRQLSRGTTFRVTIDEVTAPVLVELWQRTRDGVLHVPRDVPTGTLRGRALVAPGGSGVVNHTAEVDGAVYFVTITAAGSSLPSYRLTSAP